MTDKVRGSQSWPGGMTSRDGLAGLMEAVRCSTVRTFRLIHAIQFDSPWAPQQKDVGCA